MLNNRRERKRIEARHESGRRLLQICAQPPAPRTRIRALATGLCGDYSVSGDIGTIQFLYFKLILQLTFVQATKAPCRQLSRAHLIFHMVSRRAVSYKTGGNTQSWLSYQMHLPRIAGTSRHWVLAFTALKDGSRTQKFLSAASLHLGPISDAVRKIPELSFATIPR